MRQGRVTHRPGQTLKHETPPSRPRLGDELQSRGVFLQDRIACSIGVRHGVSLVGSAVQMEEPPAPRDLKAELSRDSGEERCPTSLVTLRDLMNPSSPAHLARSGRGRRGRDSLADGA